MSEYIDANIENISETKREIVKCNKCSRLVENYFEKVNPHGYRKTFCKDDFLCASFDEISNDFGIEKQQLFRLEGRIDDLEEIVRERTTLIILTQLIFLTALAVKLYFFFFR